MFVNAVNWFRGIAILFVVVGHVPLSVFAGYDDVKISFFNNGTFFFVFIAGFLFHHLKSRFEYTDYLKKKAKFVIAPYLFTITPGVILFSYYNLNNMVWFNDIPSMNYLYSLFYVIFHGGKIIEPLWFIPMISFVFIFSGIIKMIMEHKWFGYIMCFFLLVTLLTPRAGAAHPEIDFIHWLGVYLLGGYLSLKYNDICKNKKTIFICSVICYAILLNCDIPFFYHAELDKLILTFLFISLLSILDEMKIEIRWLDTLAKYSFGIFFIHGYLIQIVKRVILPSLDGSFFLWGGTIIFCLITPIFIIKCWDWYISSKYELLKTRYFFGV